MADIALVVDDHTFLATLVTKIVEELDYCDWHNGHVCDRLGAKVFRITLCNSEVSESGEPVVSFHTYGTNYDAQEMNFSITKISDDEVELEFSIGELTEDSLRLLKLQVLKMYRRVRLSANDKRRKSKLPPDQRGGGLNPNMKGLYVWRGALGKRSKCWKNFGEALKQKIASPELIKTMKLWDLHFRNF